MTGARSSCALLPVLLSGLTACATTGAGAGSPPTTPAGHPEERAPDPLVAEAEATWQQGQGPDAAKAAAEAFRRAAEAQPEDAARWLRLAQAEHLVARMSMPAPLDAESPPAADSAEHDPAVGDDAATDGDGRSLALAALNRSGEAAMRALEQLAPDAAAALTADAAEVPWPSPGGPIDRAAYWYALARAEAAQLTGHGEWVAVSHRTREIMERCASATPDVDHGGPDRFLGRYFAMPPVLELRDLERSRKHFERAASLASDYLGNAVARAGALDVMAQDRKSFEAQLRRALEADAVGASTEEGENLAAQREARALTRHAAELFE